MDTYNQSRDTFTAAISSTTERYLSYFPAEADRLEELKRHLANPSIDLRQRSTIPEGHMCASGILLLPGGKVLMLEHKALGIWVVPGGHYDVTDANLAETAIRETEEETGLQGVRIHPWHLTHNMPLDIDTHPIPASEKKQEGAHQHFDFRYVLEIDDPTVVLDQLSLDTNEVTSFDAIAIDAIDPTSSIAPAIKKLHLLQSQRA